MKKLIIISLLFLLVLPAISHAQKETIESCRVVASIVNDGSGDNRIKKRGGNYAAIKLDTLNAGEVLKVAPTSGTLKYVTLHARFQGGSWRTLYQGPLTDFPVSTYLAESKKEARCTHVIISVNGAHEKYEPIACTADIRVCGTGNASVDLSHPASSPSRENQKVFLKTYNGHYVSVKQGGGHAVVANPSRAGAWETFILVRLPGENKVALKATNGQFVCAEEGGGREVVANRSQAGAWETFTLVKLAGQNKVALKAANGLYVCAEGGGGQEVVANRSGVGPWETFTLVDASHPESNTVFTSREKIALKAYNGQFVCAEGGGGRELVANRSSAGPWEIFTLFKLPGRDQVALKALNGQFVCAEGGGGREVVANQSKAGEWETFTLVKRPGNNKIALKAANGLYVCAEGGGGGEVVANRSDAREWETFTLVRIK